MNSVKNHNLIFPAGNYWVGDSCYVTPELLFDCIAHENIPGVFEHEGAHLFIWGTMYGDGYYELRGVRNGAVTVDSGTLSIIPSVLIEKWSPDRTDILRGRFVKCAKPFKIAHKNCNVRFAGYSIRTT